MSNLARPPSGTLLARISEIADPGAIVADFWECQSLFSVLIARRGDAITAFENSCPHARFPLERPDGRVIVLDGTSILCAGHGAIFAMKDGACLGGPGTGAPLTKMPIEIVGDEVRLA